jgi:hypothetical protein
MQSGLNIGYRHILPTLSGLYVLVSGLTTFELNVLFMKVRLKSLLPSAVFVALLIGILELLILHPHYLSYFNFIAGGPAKGHNILIDSNIDWGQDLLRLREWMNDKGVDKLKLSWFGSAEPAYYDINYEPLPGLTNHFDLWWDVPFNPSSPEPGIYAISVTNLWEFPLEEKKVFPWFREREPDDQIGYSIHIYEVTDDS